MSLRGYNTYMLDEFLPWFFTYFTGDAVCPHCSSVVYEDEISEKGDDFIICPQCGKKIKKSDFN